jgi:NitT/TauT family transport system substrate-binding protein
VRTLIAALLLAVAARAEDMVRLGNLKFAHYGAVSHMKEVCPRYGIRLEERMFAKGLDIVPGILAGEIDLAASALDAAIAGRAAGAPVFVVAGFARGGARILARKGAGIAKIEDLKGHKVGTARGGAQELLLYAELDRHGLSQKDVEVVFLAYADLNQALAGAQLDGISQSEPQSSQALRGGAAVELVKPYDTPMGEPVRALVITEKLYANRDLALRTLKCFVDATREFIDHPDQAEKYVREKMFKGALAAQEYQDALGNAAFTYDITAEHVQTTADLMVKYGVGRLSKAPQAADFVRLDLLQEAKRALGVK